MDVDVAISEKMLELKHLAEGKAEFKIQSPEGVASYVMYDMASLEHEELWVLLLSTRNQILHTDKLYKGSVNKSAIRICEIFRQAIIKNAAAIILCHNHPSGDPMPSPEDVSVTKVICEAGELLDIEVLDHIVIGNGKFVSLKAKGMFS